MNRRKGGGVVACSYSSRKKNNKQGRKEGRKEKEKQKRRKGGRQWQKCGPP
jgi:hypothetical protein